MGLIYAAIELINGMELEMARRGFIDKDEVKRMHLNLLVDTGSYKLAINDNIQEIMQFPVVETKRAPLANGQVILCNVVSGVDLNLKTEGVIVVQWFCPAIPNLY